MSHNQAGAPETSQGKVQTSSNLEVKPVYRPEDLSNVSGQDGQERPGLYPFTRGIHPSMYRGRLWTMRQYAGFGTAAETNRRYQFLLQQGQNALSVAFDLSTQIGLDSDHPLASGEVGKVGVAIDSLRDMETLFDDIPLERISTSMTINATAAILLALYVAVAKKQAADPKKLSGTVQNDILKEYIARGTYIYPLRPALRLVTDVIQWCERELPEWNTISISGYHIREAGATAVQEVAFTLANAITYVEAAIQAGLAVDSFAPRLSFFFNAHNHFFEEVAKFRAARRLWASIMKETFQAKNERSWMLRFHTQTAGSTLTAQQPDVNIVRTTVQGLAAVLGGTQSLHTNAKDEALGLPTEEAALLALRTQQIIAYESGVANTVDPFGGSHYMEALTTQIENRVRQYLDRIASLGGMLRAIETGFVQKEIQESAYRYQKKVDGCEQVVVGVNRFQQSEESACPVLRVDPALEAEQVERLRQLRAERDPARVREALQRVEKTAHGTENLMPAILTAVEAYATVGEISDALRNAFGEYREAVVF
ncbi:MAG: methylmalonyl-CoA mutase [Acidobacteria bacterium RIFCSPLOWO2_02_FULL_59_13]|nr:MAG: methylmalonyl-CoA mutase [Acidobacteria bacterium RIFCSPLOWO2_02_FULL_59_13]